MKKHSILIVDDSIQDIHILLENLESDYQVRAETSAKSAMHSINEHGNPDLILLDINMPNTNGYEFCHQLKNLEQHKDISVIFISANDSTDEIIRGLDAGAIDYIVKPFDKDIINSKVKKAVELDQEFKALISKANSASQLVYTVMSESAYMGIIFRYLRTCFSIESIDDLVSESLSCLDELELVGTIFFKYKNFEEVESNQGEVGLLELDLMSRMYLSEKPLYEKDRRLFIIKGSVVICIKNLPDDENRRGSLRDYLILFAEAHDTKIKQIYEKNLHQKRNDNLKSIIKEMKNALNEVRSNQGTHKEIGVSILDEMIKSVEEIYFSIGLTEEQEDKISEIIRSAMSRFLDLIDIGTTLDSEMERIVVGLTELSQE